MLKYFWLLIAIPLCFSQENAEKYFSNAYQLYYKEYDFSNSWKENEKALALNKDSRYLFHKAKMLFLGKGILQNRDKAKKIVQKSIKALEKNQDGFSLYMLGWVHYVPVGIKKDYKKAIEYFNKAAEKNFSLAMNNLGVAYRYGDGVAQDYKKALFWYNKAVNLGSAYAMNNIANMHYYGKGVKQDYVEAAKWFGKASELHFPIAQYMLGVMKYYGKGIPIDREKATELFLGAASKNHVNSMYSLGILYSYGAQTDFVEAKKWFTQAAEQKNAYAMFFLGRMYDNGYGVEKNMQTAIKWYEKALALGNQDAMKRIAEIEKEKKEGNAKH